MKDIKNWMKLIVFCVLGMFLIGFSGCTESSDDDIIDDDYEMKLDVSVLTIEEKDVDIDGETSHLYDNGVYIHLKIRIDNLNEDKIYDLTTMIYAIETDTGEEYTPNFEDEPEFIGKGETIIIKASFEIKPDEIAKKLLLVDWSIEQSFDDDIALPSY